MPGGRGIVRQSNQSDNSLVVCKCHYVFRIKTLSEHAKYTEVENNADMELPYMCIHTKSVIHVQIDLNVGQISKVF